MSNNFSVYRAVALMAIAVVALAACGGIVQRTKANVSGHTKVCVDGVTYLQFPTGTVLQRKLDNSLVPC